ncbi:MAG: cupin domain-containing protein [Euryarchaeota archaeon]|jgi:mannose-6-phosphate isomerase-like protein (cupin superfamily)|nr:cupin domain-containing protein [Euryarchaeota archaeon]HHT18392.1 cupin domain-containing protein [Methanobacterium sp.]
MLIKSIDDCEYFQTSDQTTLCELLHPKNEKIKMGCSIAYALLNKGEASLPHELKTSVEIYYILEGKGVMHIDKESEEVKKGDAIYIPPGSVQWIKNNGKSLLKFLCVVTPPWKEEDEYLCD